MILLIDPHKKIFFLIVPDPAGIGPVTCHSRARQQRRNWFVKQEVICDKLFLLSVCHPVERVVPDGKGMIIIYDDDRVGKNVTRPWKVFVQNWRATKLLKIQTTGFWKITCASIWKHKTTSCTGATCVITSVSYDPFIGNLRNYHSFVWKGLQANKRTTVVYFYLEEVLKTISQRYDWLVLPTQQIVSFQTASKSEWLDNQAICLFLIFALSITGADSFQPFHYIKMSGNTVSTLDEHFVYVFDHEK